jgi:ATP-dependent exoDNAse (exonuclease V) beta subunit
MEITRLKKYTSYAGGFVYNRKTNFLSWILLSNNSVIPNIISSSNISFKNDTDTPDLSNSDNLDEEAIERLREEFSRRFAFNYHAEAASSIPAKLSVSELYPTILDDYDYSEKIADKKKARMRLPKFIDENDSKGAKIGTATHQFMQFCDFEMLKSFGVEKEIERMTERGFLSPDIASLVSVNAIKRFINTEIFSFKYPTTCNNNRI